MTMKWIDLKRALEARGALSSGDDAPESQNPTVTGIAYDSRDVTPGQAFVALKGLQTDGSLFARQAVERGAVAVVAEHAVSGLRVPTAQVEDARRALAVLAAEFYGHPS